MNKVLTIVRWGFTIPIFILECIFKALARLLVTIMTVLMAIAYPLIRRSWNRFNRSTIYKYANVWKTFPITRAVYKSWK
uniref:Uncharacterized protein n=1 Tax=Podoviridae sp. ct8Lf7 TaxID=2827723 RepID=A0A8S5S1X5_9CAUD|nr:MAG TPA: hypothetical protein [Podoviridae sp. ct8Lf7]